MYGESWDVFTKQMLVAKHIRDTMYENPGGPIKASSFPPLPTPMTTA